MTVEIGCWTPDLPDDEILARLLALNHQCAAV